MLFVLEKFHKSCLLCNGAEVQKEDKNTKISG